MKNESCFLPDIKSAVEMRMSHLNEETAYWLEELKLFQAQQRNFCLKCGHKDRCNHFSDSFSPLEIPMEV